MKKRIKMVWAILFIILSIPVILLKKKTDAPILHGKVDFGIKYKDVKKEIPKTLIVHRNKDRVVPISQSLILKEKMESINLPIQFHVLEGVDHAFMNATPQQKEKTQKWITDFVINQYAE